MLFRMRRRGEGLVLRRERSGITDDGPVNLLPHLGDRIITYGEYRIQT